MLKSKVTNVGSSTGVVLPQEILAKLHVEQGDTLCFIETPDGFEITPCDPEFEEEMDSAHKVMHKYRNALRELAK
jgi:putative addiction module antidote